MRTSTSTTFILSTCLVALLGFVGCKKGTTTPPDEGGTTSGEADSGEVAPPDDGAADDGDAGEPTTLAWADMDRGKRLEYMGTTVMPKMKEAFKAQGQDIKCANCHGNNYKEVDFAMPNDLTPLNPDNPIQSGMDIDEETTKFMVSVVLPQMAEMLGEQTDVTTGKGEFGCLSCHLSE
ncbi:hypothetical protein ACNOYE_18015 [Nannocystaceae bacterium ST9]